MKLQLRHKRFSITIYGNKLLSPAGYWYVLAAAGMPAGKESDNDDQGPEHVYT